MPPTHKQLTPRQALRYNRQILLPGFGLEAQEALLNASVLLVGVGGLGNSAAEHLVAAGLGTLTLVDDDKVALSNLPRQCLFSEQDEGCNKAQAAIARLQALNPDCHLHALPTRLHETALKTQIEAHDLVLDCTDNLASKNLVNQLCVRQHKPLVVGAAIRFEGQLFSYAPGADWPCYQCVSTLFAEPQLSCVESGILSPVVAVIGVMQALEAIKLLTSIGEASLGRLQVFDGLSGQWRSLRVKRHADCPGCATASTLAPRQQS